jgi:hypothetical protein
MVEEKYKERLIRVYAQRIADSGWRAQVYIYQVSGEAGNVVLVYNDKLEAFPSNTDAEESGLRFARTWIDGQIS